MIEERSVSEARVRRVIQRSGYEFDDLRCRRIGQRHTRPLRDRETSDLVHAIYLHLIEDLYWTYQQAVRFFGAVNSSTALYFRNLRPVTTDVLAHLDDLRQDFSPPPFPTCAHCGQPLPQAERRSA